MNDGAARERSASPAIDAKAAKPAIVEPWRGDPGRSPACDERRMDAKQAAHSLAAAVLRKRAGVLAPHAPRDFSQASRDSQAMAGIPDEGEDGAGWTDAELAAFRNRRARALRLGWPPQEAEVLAAGLVLRDRAGDVRIACVECCLYVNGKCAAPARAGLSSAAVGRDMAGTLQRCAAFRPAPWSSAR